MVNPSDNQPQAWKNFGKFSQALYITGFDRITQINSDFFYAIWSFTDFREFYG